MNYIYLDYKDSQSYKRCSKLEEILNNSNKGKKESYVQQINSTDSSLIQLTDLLTGWVCYNANRKTTSNAKSELIRIIETELKIDIFLTTSVTTVNKFDILNWRPN